MKCKPKQMNTLKTILLIIKIITLLSSVYLESIPSEVHKPKNSGQENVRAEFERFLRDHEIQFISPLEKEFRFKRWLENRQEVKKFNYENHGVELKLNDFSIMSKSEFKNTMTNPDFLFMGADGQKHHINLNDPVNQEVIDREIDANNRDLLGMIQDEISDPTLGLSDRAILSKIKEATEKSKINVEEELNSLHNFLNNHQIEHTSEILSYQEKNDLEEYIKLAEDTVDHMIDYHGKKKLYLFLIYLR